ncbi:phospholipase DDHD1-like isoform X2 [Mytilus californianus]|uniref:phospholipase DDHD1-like isoform X2 n=1 Tax=Mytilus californianus TaxID=6549 RepID=UPI0022461145|nr:phospholipase DDHD1-like isoform X2 [Mytilus californianus]
MMSEFGSLGDGIFSSNSRHSSSSRSSNDRLYPSLFESDEDSPDSDCFSTVSESRSTPPLTRQKNLLFPVNEEVDHLRPEEVRWLYKSKSDKKWHSFIGYDSLRIECRFRALQTIDEDEDIIDNDVISVRGGLYEVDVVLKTCKPVYWSGDESEITRGLWFYDQDWQPLEEGYSQQLEAEHISKFLGRRLDEFVPSPLKGKKPVLLLLKFEWFYVEWNGPNDVHLYSESMSSKFARAVGNKLGLQRAGSRLQRGYRYEAVMDDKPSDITHLIFVVHGIGQKMDTGSIVKSCIELREKCVSIKNKTFPQLDCDNKRAEFLPVEWRSSLILDGDTVDSITPNKMLGFRSILNSSAMDILYYTSPLYRSEITQSLQTQINQLFDKFCGKNPYFMPSGGKISVVAHSLGAVITYDILTGWNPIVLYDQLVSKVIDEEKEQAQGSDELLNELNEAKKRVIELETLLTGVHDKQNSANSALKFHVENLFCVGSPLAVFLALRGVRPTPKGTIDHILPQSVCKRLFNLYHPYDPVAYRIEPLILKHYTTVMPLPIHKYDATNKVPYQTMKTKAYAAFESGSRSGSMEKLTEKVGHLFKKKEIKDQMSAELKNLEKMEKEGEEIELTFDKQSRSVSMTVLPLEQAEQTDLEYRIDYQIRLGNFTNSYISLLTSHTSYWGNKDLAYFILTHLFPGLEDS